MVRLPTGTDRVQVIVIDYHSSSSMGSLLDWSSTCRYNSNNHNNNNNNKKKKKKKKKNDY